jgi:hypothetical protein
VQRVLSEMPVHAKVSAGLVWVHALEADDAPAAQVAAAQIQHIRLAHFHDPGKLAARRMAAVLGGAGHFAWDVYLVFAPQATWTDLPPQPVDWVHQLDHAAWAPAERRRKGEALVQALESLLAGALTES